MLALLLSRLTAEEERRLKMSVGRSAALLRFCEEAFRHKHAGADWILAYSRNDARPVSRESTRKLIERLLSHVFQVLAGSPEVQECGQQTMDAAHASECVKCGVFIVQSLGNRGVPVRWLLAFLEKRAELCRSFGLVEDLVAVQSQRLLMMQQLALPGNTSEPEGVYRDLLKATENMRFLIESEQFLFNHLEEFGNCFLPGREKVDELERRIAEISVFNHRSRFVFLSFVQLVLQSRVFFAKGDALTGKRLVGEVVSMTDEFSEVTYRLKNSPYGSNGFGIGTPGIQEPSKGTDQGHGVILQFPRFFGLIHEPVILDLVYSRQADLAAELIQLFLPPVSSERAIVFPARWYVIQGFIQFRNGEFQRAAQSCRVAEGVPDGIRSSWSMGVRLLSIFISIENGATDLASHRIESLRKFMERQHRIQQFSKREHLILRMLSGLMRSDFDFRKVALGYAEELDLLASPEEGFAWVPGGYELIPFQEWLRGKAGSI